jgi:hypothetical protein
MNLGAQQKTMLKNRSQQIEKCSKKDSQMDPQRRTKTYKNKNKPFGDLSEKILKRAPILGSK